MTYPSTVIEPSHLFSDHYQQQIQKQIQMSVRSDDRRKDTLLDLDTLTLSQAVKHLMRLTQPSSQISTVKDIVNHLMQNMHGPESQMMNDLIQTQRHLYKEVKEFKKQPCNVKKRQQISQKFQELLDKCEMNVKKLNSKLDEIPQGQQQPEESAISHSFILSFKKTMKEVAKIQEKVRLILPPHEQISVQKKFRTIKDQFKSVRQKQEQHSISKQSQELNKSHLEVEPEQRSMYRFFLDLERQTIQASQSIHQNPDNLESAKPYMDKVMKKSEAAKEALDQSLIRDGKLCKMMRVKAFEVVLKHKLIAQDLEERLSKHNPISPSTDQPEQKMRDIKELQQKLKKLSTEISKRISFAVNNEKESSQTTEMLKQDQDDIKSLQIHEVKQLQTIEYLKHLREKLNEKQHPSDAQQSDSQITSPELEVRKVIETVQQIHESIKHIFEKRETEQKQTLSPVLIKTLKILSKHALIMDKVRQFLKQCRLQTFMNKEWSPLTSQVYSPKFVPVQSAEQSSFSEEMKNKIEFLEKESLKLLKKINKFLSKKRPSMKHSSNEQSSEESYEISNKIPSMSSDYSTRQILQKVHKVQAHQLQQESVVQSMIKVCYNYINLLKERVLFNVDLGKLTFILVSKL